MIIAIDGPAASGKSTTAKNVAKELGFAYFDTGAMYRAVTLAAIKKNIDIENETELADLLEDLDLEIENKDGKTVLKMDGKNIAKAIRSVEVTSKVSAVSAIPIVREKMVKIQQELGINTNCVMEGRDIGTVVFPDADAKFFITADYRSRAERRHKDLQIIGEEKSIDELVVDLKLRDKKDSTRSKSPLKKANDAIEIDTSNVTVKEQVAIIVDHINKITTKKEGLMPEKIITEPVIEEANVELEQSAEVSAEPVQPDSEPITEMKPIINYLDDKLFAGVKVVTQTELDENIVIEEVPEDLQKQYLDTISDISANTVISGRVIGMNEKEVLVDIGFKSEGLITRDEFEKNKLPEIGEKINVYLEKLEDRKGNTILSKIKADFMHRWKELHEIYENGEILKGTIIRRIKGGMVVDVGVVQAFLPGSQIDVRPIKDFDQFIDQEMDFQIVKINEARKNVVISHKILMEETMKEQRAELFSNIQVGEILEGRVKNITDFGVFIDLGGVDGLLHITDLSWGRVNHPSEIVKMDETIIVKVIDFDEEKKRVSLGLKQLSSHPWEEVEERYAVGTVIKGKVVSMTNYGVFIELEPGVEGLIHVSEMTWTRHIKNPSELYSMGDEVEAQVLSIDKEERKISMGVKQLEPDPWDKIEEKYMVGTVHKGKVINLTQFGAFVELMEGIDGLIHVSDLSWTKIVRHPKEILEKGEKIEVRVLEVSRENRRISLGLKQVEDDPWPELVKYFETGKKIKGEIIRVLDRGVIVQLDKDVEGIVPFDAHSKKDRKLISGSFKTGASIEAIVMEVKPEEKKVFLFIDELGGPKKKKVTKNPVKEFLDNQESPATEKIEIPEGLIEQSNKSND
ncbi:(d)CMP kinase [Candidatus Neomarinimicrobiota bacterium]